MPEMQKAGFLFEKHTVVNQLFQFTNFSKALI